MSNTNKTTTTSGLSFFSILTIVFIVLKLCKIINWSWFWVLSPTIIPLILVVLMGIIIVIFHNK